MRQKVFVIISIVSVLLFHLAEGQEPPKKLYRIGYLSLSNSSDSVQRRNLQAFRQRLRELGYVEGKTITIEFRYGEDKPNQLPALAADLVNLKVDCILTNSTPAAMAAKRATSTIPIVLAGGTDPEATGLIASLAQPGGNITGVTVMNAELAGKRLELLRETNSKVSRVIVFWNSTNPGNTVVFNQTKNAAQELHLQVQPFDIKSLSDLDAALKNATGTGGNALVFSANSPVSNHLKQIVDFAIKNRLPSMYDRGSFPEAGGLMSYGANLPDIYSRAAVYVDKILKGAKPADLPVEQPTKFELVINLKTAQEIGMTIPQSVLFRADKVIK